jgi:abhydrolase domain-containing protein 13
LVEKHPNLFRGLIVENTFTSISDMVDIIFPFLKPMKNFILKIGWRNIDLVPRLTLPVYYVTGNQDEIVPYEHTKELN